MARDERVSVSHLAVCRDHLLAPGPTLVVGVNGSGKTTLISMMLRCLTGPYDLPAATSESELGQVRPRAVRVSRPMLVVVLKAPAGEACALIADQLFPKGFA